ncbi:MAG: guanylate kinase [Candidatus Cloacimonetes bacterium]|nr:guanylate kinase [Candidatus Cloacimonadota bacterium]
MPYEHKPYLLILIAPSGGGKSTLCDEILKRYSDFVYSISSTTRQARGDERDGVDYQFLAEAEFLKRQKAGAFIESALVHGKWYGTSREFIGQQLAAGKNIILDIDVQGALKILASGIECVTVFLLPPSQAVLRERLERRGTDDREAIELRMQNAADEIALIHRFDYLVINDALESAVGDLEKIIRAEKLRVERYKEIRENYYRSENA